MNFQYAIDDIPIEERGVWNSQHTFSDINARRETLQAKALAGIPEKERPTMVLIEWSAIKFPNVIDLVTTKLATGNPGTGILYNMFLVFKMEWLFTEKGRKRSIERALKIMGAPLVNVARASNGWEIRSNGNPAIDIARLK